MTAAATEPIPSDSWAKQLEQLKTLYKHVRPPILVALNILLHDANVSVDDAKARAAARGVRITAASLNAAKTLLSRMDTAPATKPAAAPTTTPTRAPRRTRSGEIPFDTEALVRGVVAKLQTQGNAEAERLRDGIRRALAALQATLEA
jgi:hypothetical protein